MDCEADSEVFPGECREGRVSGDFMYAVLCCCLSLGKEAGWWASRGVL